MVSALRRFILSRNAPDRASLDVAARILREGGLVIFPTETVYGLGANAAHPEAITRLNAVKMRPPDKPYTLHVYRVAQVETLVTHVPPMARRLMERFWPGPVTIVMPVPDGTTRGFRLPDHPVARAFLEACDVPVVAPSANRAGAPPPTSAETAVRELEGLVDCVLDSGPTPLGRESTVVEVVNGQCLIRREGAIPRETILAALTS